MKAYHLYTSYPMILKAIMILKFVEFILPLPLSCWEIPFYPYCPNAPRWAPAAQWHYINKLVSNFTRANKKRRKVIPPFNEFFPEQLYLKNFQAASAFFRNFLSCPPPTGRVPSDTISTNQFQISRVNKKQGCLTTKPSIFPFHAAHPPLGTCGQVILGMSTNQFQISRANKKKTRMPAKSDTSF